MLLFFMGDLFFEIFQPDMAVAFKFLQALQGVRAIFQLGLHGG